VPGDVRGRVYYGGDCVGAGDCVSVGGDAVRELTPFEKVVWGGVVCMSWGVLVLVVWMWIF